MTSPAAAVSMFQFGTAETAPAGAGADVAGRSRDGLTGGATETLHLITTRAGFDALEAEWNALFDRAGRGEQMFQSFNWLWHWANHFLADDADALAIVTVRRGGRLAGVLPLLTERVAGLKQLVFLGAPVSQYGDAVIETMPDQDAVLGRALALAIGATGAAVVRLAKVRDDAAIAPVMRRLGATITSAEEAPFADLAKTGTQAAYDARFSTKWKKNRRRLERRLGEHGAIELDWNQKGRDAAAAAVTTMVLKRAWLKTRGQLSRAFADERSDRFFADVCAGKIRPAGGQVSLLKSGGEIANGAITVTVKGRQAVHILAYGLKFEKCAAGILHVEKMIEQAFATGVTTIDFLAPRHDYKLEWADGAVRVADFALPVTLAGRVYSRLYLGLVRERLKAVIRAAPRALTGPVAMIQAAIKMAGSKGRATVLLTGGE